MYYYHSAKGCVMYNFLHVNLSVMETMSFIKLCFRNQIWWIIMC